MPRTDANPPVFVARKMACNPAITAKKATTPMTARSTKRLRCGMRNATRNTQIKNETS